ncbi:hypothetical protein COB64_03375 [Candidatus Wolfebacteria bacterium]|nr:MAG: hypothetical protein COB64_03375 [Candidatus Wolfebacteria bacterium]
MNLLNYVNGKQLIFMEKWRKQGFHVEYGENKNKGNTILMIVIKHKERNKTYRCDANYPHTLDRVAQFYIWCLCNSAISKTVTQKLERAPKSRDEIISGVIKAQLN